MITSYLESVLPTLTLRVSLQIFGTERHRQRDTLGSEIGGKDQLLANLLQYVDPRSPVL